MEKMKYIPILMIKRFLLLLLVAGLAFTGCKRDIPDNCSRELTLKLCFSLDFYQDNIHTTYSDQWSDYDMRFIVDVYPDNISNPALADRMERMVHTVSAPPRGSHEVFVNFQMPDQKVKLLVWADFVTRNTQTDLHYTTSDLRMVRIIPPYVCGLHPKAAFTTVYELNPLQLPGNPAVVTVDLEIPFAKYKIVSSDLTRFQSDNPTTDVMADLTSKVLYGLFTPFRYDVLTGDVNEALGSVTFNSSKSEMTANSVVVTSDYIFVSKSHVGTLPSSLGMIDASTTIALLEIRKNGTDLVTSTSDIWVPLRRGYMTLISGDYLTSKTAGVGVDDGFDGDEIIIILPD
jgi:hypothetical protein